MPVRPNGLGGTSWRVPLGGFRLFTVKTSSHSIVGHGAARALAGRPGGDRRAPGPVRPLHRRPGLGGPAGDVRRRWRDGAWRRGGGPGPGAAAVGADPDRRRVLAP